MIMCQNEIRPAITGNLLPAGRRYDDFHGCICPQSSAKCQSVCAERWAAQKRVQMCGADLHLSPSNWEELGGAGGCMRAIDTPYELPADRCDAWSQLAALGAAVREENTPLRGQTSFFPQ